MSVIHIYNILVYIYVHVSLCVGVCLGLGVDVCWCVCLVGCLLCVCLCCCVCVCVCVCVWMMDGRADVKELLIIRASIRGGKGKTVCVCVCVWVCACVCRCVWVCRCVGEYVCGCVWLWVSMKDGSDDTSPRLMCCKLNYYISLYVCVCVCVCVHRHWCTPSGVGGGPVGLRGCAASIFQDKQSNTARAVAQSRL